MEPSAASPKLDVEIKTGTDAYLLFGKLEQAANTPFEKLARIEGALSGNPPYDAADLRAAGLDDMTNMNFRLLKAGVKKKSAQYVDLIASPRTPASIRWKQPPRPQFATLENNLLSDAFGRYLQDTGIAFDRVCRVRTTVEKGAGFFLFADGESLRPRLVRRDNVYLPVNAKSRLDDNDVIALTASFKAHELYARWQKAKDQAKSMWQADGLRKALMRLHPDYSADADPSVNYSAERWTAWQHALDISGGSGENAAVLNREIRVARMFVRNGNGKIDKYIIDATCAASGFLYKETDHADDFCDFILPQYYDPTEELYWKVEGLGHDLYNEHVLADRLRGKMFDITDLAMTPVLKHGSGNSRGKQSSRKIDRFIHLTPTDELESSLLQARGDLPMAMHSMLDELIDSKTTHTPMNSQQRSGAKTPISAAEARGDQIDVDEVRLMEANEFYNLEDELLRSVFKRLLKKADQGDELKGPAKDFFAAIEPITALMGDATIKPDDFHVSATRAIGAGSARSRMQALQAGFAMRGALNPIGRKNITQDYYAELFGPDATPRYFGDYDPSQFPVKESADARQENLFFEMGKDPGISMDEIHDLHIEAHLPFLEERAQAGMQSDGQLNAQQLGQLSTLFQAAMPHVGRHLDIFGQQVDTEELKVKHDEFMKRYAELVNVSQKFIQNARDAAQAEQEQAVEQQQQHQALMQQMEQRAAGAESRLRDKLAEDQRAQQLHQETMREMREKHDLEVSRLRAELTAATRR